MGRLIDCDVLCERLLNAWDCFDKEKKKDISRIMADVVTPIVVGTPTAEECKTGEWIFHQDWYDEGLCAYECSVCERAYDYDMNYCGYCGAKMV